MSALKTLVESHLQDIKSDSTQYSGYIDGETEYDMFVSQARSLGFTFSTAHSIKNKSSRILFTAKGKVADYNIPYCGSPFQIVRAAYMTCCHGGRRYKGGLPETLMDKSPLKKRRKMQSTIKIGCLATMAVKCLRVFTEDCYKINGPYKRNCADNRKILKRLNKELLSASPPVSTSRFMIVMSSEEVHNHTVLGMPICPQEMIYPVTTTSSVIQEITLPRTSRGITKPIVDYSGFDIIYDDLLEVNTNYQYTPENNISEDEESEESEDEEIDLKKLWEEGREKLQVILGCTYLKHAPEDVFKIVKLIRLVEDMALSSARKSNVGLLASKSRVSKKAKKTISMKYKSKMFPHLKNSQCMVEHNYVTSEWPDRTELIVDVNRLVFQQCDENLVIDYHNK